MSKVKKWDNVTMPLFLFFFVKIFHLKNYC